MSKAVAHIDPAEAAPPARTRLKVFHLLYEDYKWCVKLQGKRKPIYEHDQRQPVYQYAVSVAKAEQPSSLRIHGKDGRIRDERTYPRSADPKKSKG